MFKKVLLYGLATLGILATSFIIFAVVFYDDTEAEVEDGVYYAENEKPNKLYYPGEMVMNQDVLFIVDDATKYEPVENTGSSDAPYELEIQYSVANKTDEKLFEELIVSSADFTLKSEDGKEYEPNLSSSDVNSHLQNGKAKEGFVTFHVDELDTYVLEFSSDAYTEEPRKVSYRIKLQ